jgi:hypothetical protein
MISLFSGDGKRKAGRYKIILCSLFLYGALCAAAFSACDTDPAGGPGTLAGYWKSGYGDGFEVTGATFTQYDDDAKHISFAGTIVNNPDLTASSGSITIIITNAGTWKKTPDHFFVIRWRNLSGRGVEEAAAGIWGVDPAPGKPTQPAAESAYTIDNGYFANFAAYQRQ